MNYHRLHGIDIGVGIERRTILRLAALLALISAVGIGVLHTIDFTIDFADLEEGFAGGPYPLNFQNTFFGRRIHTAAIGDQSRPPVVFIHRTPDSWENFATIMAESSLLDVACLICLDRPGFGGSGGDRAEPSANGQSAAVAAVIRMSEELARSEGHQTHPDI